MKKTRVFEDLCYHARRADDLERFVNERLRDIFGRLMFQDSDGKRESYCVFDYDAQEEEVNLIEFPKGFRPKPEQLEAVWDLGAKRLQISCYEPDPKIGFVKVYYYRGGPTEGRVVQTPPRRKSKRVP